MEGEGGGVGWRVSVEGRGGMQLAVSSRMVCMTITYYLQLTTTTYYLLTYRLLANRLHDDLLPRPQHQVLPQRTPLGEVVQ